MCNGSGLVERTALQNDEFEVVHIVDEDRDLGMQCHTKPENHSTSSGINKEKHRRRCAFAVINALQPVMSVKDSFQDMAMTLASFYRCTNFSEPLQHVQAAQVCKENIAPKLTTAVAPL
ncbi:hypothetical protein ACFX2C_044664 [Malus domestica]